MEATVAMVISQMRSRLKQEIRHNPGGIADVMQNRKSCLAAAGGDGESVQSLEMQIGILEQIQREAELPIVIGQSRPRF
ncbi:hypothetical protein AMJ47_03215 [Parcubacteria bacterium DG_72]|nr:MAG: hypothetical protein AMJ47_03215 [Parcubacteria bacterium DG_72]